MKKELEKKEMEEKDLHQLQRLFKQKHKLGGTSMNRLLTQQESVAIAFQEGFSNDEVQILINGSESCRMFNVSTHSPRQTANLNLQNIPKPIALEIRLPQRNVSKSFQLSGSHQLHLDISLSPESHICSKLQRRTSSASHFVSSLN